MSAVLTSAFIAAFWLTSDGFNERFLQKQKKVLAAAAADAVSEGSQVVDERHTVLCACTEILHNILVSVVAFAISCTPLHKTRRIPCAKNHQAVCADIQKLQSAPFVHADCLVPDYA
jgi:hypothetical protein